MARSRIHFDAKRMEPLVSRWRLDPMAFRVEAFDSVVTPTVQQCCVLSAMSSPNARVMVSSGHGVGKTNLLASLVLWGLTCFGDIKIMCTAPTSDQLSGGLWPEIWKMYRAIIPVFGGDYLTITNDRIVRTDSPDVRFAMARSASTARPESLQGLHAKNILIIVDEASGVSDTVFETLEGNLSTSNSRIIAASNPTNPFGYFHNTFRIRPKNWRLLRLDCRDSGLVDPSYSEDIRERYGADSNMYRVRVQGLFPKTSSNHLFSRADFDDAVRRDGVPDGFVVAGLDVARHGPDRSVLAVRDGTSVVGLHYWSHKNGEELSELVSQLWSRYQWSDLRVDMTGGHGGSVYDHLSRRLRDGLLSFTMQPVVNSSSSRENGRFMRLRDEIWWMLAEAFREGEIGFGLLRNSIRFEEECSSEVDSSGVPRDRFESVVQDLWGEMREVSYHFSETGKIKVSSKEDIRKSCGSSPDVTDALTLTFWDSRIVSTSALDVFSGRAAGCRVNWDTISNGDCGPCSSH